MAVVPVGSVPMKFPATVVSSSAAATQVGALARIGVNLGDHVGGERADGEREVVDQAAKRLGPFARPPISRSPVAVISSGTGIADEPTAAPLT